MPERTRVDVLTDLAQAASAPTQAKFLYLHEIPQWEIDAWLDAQRERLRALKDELATMPMGDRS